MKRKVTEEEALRALAEMGAYVEGYYVGAYERVEAIVTARIRNLKHEMPEKK